MVIDQINIMDHPTTMIHTPHSMTFKIDIKFPLFKFHIPFSLSGGQCLMEVTIDFNFNLLEDSTHLGSIKQFESTLVIALSSHKENDFSPLCGVEI